MTSSCAAGDAPLIGVLALQGDYAEHIRALERCGARTVKVRLPQDLDPIAGLVLPGGESTTMVKLAKEWGLFEALRAKGRTGLPMFGTCAGAILLGCGDEHPERLGLVPVQVRRNAYGRQRESFEKRLPLGGALHSDGAEGLLAIFIRAPKIDLPLNRTVEVLARDGDDPVLLRYRSFLLATFHPELTEDLRVHRLFLEMVRATAAGR